MKVRKIACKKGSFFVNPNYPRITSHEGNQGLPFFLLPHKLELYFGNGNYRNRSLAA